MDSFWLTWLIIASIFIIAGWIVRLAGDKNSKTERTGRVLEVIGQVMGAVYFTSLLFS